MRTRRNYFARLVGFFSILLASIAATAQTTNALSDAEIQGRQLAQKLLDQRPTESFTNTGVHQIRDGGLQQEVPLKCETVVTPTNWYIFYAAGVATIKISHYGFGQDNEYEFHAEDGKESTPSGNDLMASFAGSDFWLVDLGLEFLHWPGQKVLRGDTARGRLCKVLESTNPDPSTNGYSRVLCWIDNETFGIVEAKAYDAQGKLLKEFYPKDIKRVDGQWRVGSMEIDNVQTGSRTRLEMDLKSK